MYSIPIPIIADPAHYGGQMGVPGSASALGIRLAPRAVAIFVDKGHPDASDAHDGTDPEHPKLTIQGAVSSALLTTGSVIAVQAGDYTESVVTRAYGVGPSYVTLLGLSSGGYSPYWDSPAAASPCLDLRAPGWRVAGFRFTANTGAYAVYLRHTVPGASDIAINTIIEDCVFYGGTTGLGGIAGHGAPYEIIIRRCKFGFHHTGASAGTAIGDTDVSVASAYRWLIEDCDFYENDNHIDLAANVSIIRNCRFITDGAYAAGKIIDLRAGTIGHNMVTGCTLMGDYSNTGGYWDTAAGAGCWVGNFSNDLLASETGDNGLTIAPPAA
jgi:hypothetical protein